MGIFNKLFNSLKNGNDDNLIKDLNWKEFYENYKNSTKGFLLDVRTVEEYREVRIPGATLIDYHSLDFKEKIAQLDKQKEYFVYCRRGIRSRNTVKIMRELGFNKINNLISGITGWEGPTESDI